jgi:hypothetical protein
MRRQLLYALLGGTVAAVVFLALAARDEPGTSVPASAPAAPQRAELGWVERYPAEGGGLVFRVASFEVHDDGWKADVSVTNESPARFAVGDPKASLDRTFGVMLFRTGDLREVDQRFQAGDAPGLRSAREITPPLPLVLEPGATWEGELAAPGSLAAGRWARIVFGRFIPIGDAPSGLDQPFAWTTDNAYRLRGGEPAVVPASTG